MTDGAKRDDGGSRRAGRGERDREAAARRPVFLDPSDTACAGREISPLQTARQAHLMAPSYALMTTVRPLRFSILCTEGARRSSVARHFRACARIGMRFFVCSRSNPGGDGISIPVANRPGVAELRFDNDDAVRSTFAPAEGARRSSIARHSRESEGIGMGFSVSSRSRARDSGISNPKES